MRVHGYLVATVTGATAHSVAADYPHTVVSSKALSLEVATVVPSTLCETYVACQEESGCVIDLRGYCTSSRPN